MTTVVGSEGSGGTGRRFDPGDRWVPVDRRWLGLDRATILPALVVLGLAILMGSILPSIDTAVPYRDTVAAGDVMQLDGGITFTPAPGWGITDGVRAGANPVTKVYPPTAKLVDGPIRFGLYTAPFAGTPLDLLRQIERTDTLLDGASAITGDPAVIVNQDGAKGLLARFTRGGSDGVIAAYVLDGRGVQAVALGPTGLTPEQTRNIADMIVSIGRTREAL
ncbi:hypothetical protein [Nocardia sp. alder85J]|uniref:hypothetical protein n=1 Tax=Nocardia sp. alder85J TaxID=2862949 RepID=UPI001CD1C8AA|nr:hypothetical protein [Nocardia sp. alder85J]MCX4093231.1 hypothetical protein [Nocardia sp. alder85J]